MLIAILASAINTFMHDPYPHKDVKPGLLIKNYPNVTINHSYDRKMPDPVVKVKKSKGVRTVEGGNSSMNNSSALNRSSSMRK
jgi:hypothetical protein